MAKPGIERVGSKCRNVVEIVILKAKYVFSVGTCTDSLKKHLHGWEPTYKEMADNEIKLRQHKIFLDLGNNKHSTSREPVDGNLPKF